MKRHPDLFYLMLSPFLAGCLYASLPKDPPFMNPCIQTNSAISCSASEPSADDLATQYYTALTYLNRTLDSYNFFLTANEAITIYGIGAPLFAAGGAVLGMAAAGASADSSLASAQLGIGGGTLTGYWLWSRNKPKLDAYNVGRKALDCVRSQANQSRV